MKTLVNFLLKNKVYKEFLDNFYAVNNSISDYVKSTSLIDQIKLAFNWENTTEGYDFWKDVDKKWLEYLYN